MPGHRDIARQSQRFVQVLDFEHVVAAGHLGALGERAVGDHRRVRAAGDAHRGRGGMQGIAGADRRGLAAWKSWYLAISSAASSGVRSSSLLINKAKYCICRHLQ